MECNNECTTCQTSCNKTCPICEKTGLIVNSATVLNLTNRTDLRLNNKHFICTNPKCECVYFDEEYTYAIKKEEVNVPIWFKSRINNYLVCYCKKIYLTEIIDAVMKLNNPTKEEIIKYLGKESIEQNCLVNNPISKSCDKLFKNAINYAKELKERGN